MTSGGWIGTNGQVLHFLRSVNADRDEDGRFIIAGGGVNTFLGMQGPDVDVVISGETVFFLQGKPVGLAGELRKTSYGVGVVVIGG